MITPHARGAMAVLATAGVTAAILATPLVLGHRLRGHSAGSGATATSSGVTLPVTRADIATVQSYGDTLATKAGTHVQVVHVPGSAVWATYLSGVSDDLRDARKAHDMLVVRSTDPPPGMGSRRPGDDTPYVIISLVIDATDGLLLNTGLAPEGNDDFQDNSQFGPTTDVEITKPSGH